MKKNPVEMALLLDFYGDILTEKQKEFFEYYHAEDLSLSEIAENVGITRQGVRDVIGRAEDTLNEMEQKLGLVSRFIRIQAEMRKIYDAATVITIANERRGNVADIRDKAELIKKIAGSVGFGGEL